MTEADILVVEDERIVAEDIKETLEDIGYSVVDIVSSGEEAVKKSNESRPDLVLMDIVLTGEMDGVEAAEKIRSEEDIPVIYLTAYSDDEKLKRAKVTEPFGYIIKPFRRRELHSNIEMALYKHEMEKKLKQSERRYRTIFESTGTAMVILDGDRKIRMANEKAEELTGYSKEELEGMKWSEFVVPEDAKRMRQYHKLRRRDPESVPKYYNFTLINRFGDTKEIFLTIDLIPETDRSVASLIDITEYIDAYQALRESQESFRVIFENCPTPLAILDPDGTFNDLNEAFTRSLGYFEEDLLSEDFTSVIHQDDAEQGRDMVKRIIDRESDEEREELKLVMSEKEEKKMRVTVKNIPDEKGSLIQMIVILEDI